eukprot:2718448-Alexandrium_andersonii.AAC.1
MFRTVDMRSELFRCVPVSVELVIHGRAFCIPLSDCRRSVARILVRLRPGIANVARYAWARGHT